VLLTFSVTCAQHYENPTMLSKVTAKNVGDVFFETHCIILVISMCHLVGGKVTVGQGPGVKLHLVWSYISGFVV